MPIKIFEGGADGIAGLETKINAWMETLEAGAVRYLTTTAAGGGQQVVVTVWYTERKDKN
jgi:hypothetical protein